MSVRIKLCGVRRPEDAVLCAEAGADEVGVVFAARSRRRVTLDEARAIRAALPERVPLVGVFVDATLDELREAAAAADLSALQLHGKVPAGAELMGVPLYRALHVTASGTLGSLGGLGRKFARALLDGPQGGSGKTFPWEVATAIRSRYTGELFVAGGLHAGNVAEAIAAAAPDGVDVASGIEAEDGFKDPARVRAFVAAVRAAG